MGALFLTVFLALTAADRHGEGICVTGTSIGCDDRDPCTDDRCEGLACVHTPATGPACDDHDRCTERDRCDAGTCAGVPVVCEDDGFSCTDDVCVAGRCAHVPVDSRCVAETECTSAGCTPESADHDPAGCAPGPARADGEECAEDGDACTADVCAGGRCDHVGTAERATCAALQPAFRHALALESSAGALLSVAPRAFAERLGDIRDTLGATGRALAGKADADAPGSAPLADTALQRRARLALSVLQRTRPQVGGFVRAVSRSRAELGPETALDLGRRGRALARGTRELRAELQRLMRARGSFARRVYG